MFVNEDVVKVMHSEQVNVKKLKKVITVFALSLHGHVPSSTEQCLR